MGTAPAVPQGEVVQGLRGVVGRAEQVVLGHPEGRIGGVAGLALHRSRPAAASPEASVEHAAAVRAMRD